MSQATPAAGNISARAASIPMIRQSITAAGWADSVRTLISRLGQLGARPDSAIVDWTPLSPNELTALGAELGITIRIGPTAGLHLGDRMPL